MCRSVGPGCTARRVDDPDAKGRQSRTLAVMEEATVTIPDLSEGDLRSLFVRTSTYVFELTRAEDGATSTRFQTITETPAQGAGATEHPRSAPDE